MSNILCISQKIFLLRNYAIKIVAQLSEFSLSSVTSCHVTVAMIHEPLVDANPLNLKVDLRDCLQTHKLSARVSNHNFL